MLLADPFLKDQIPERPNMIFRSARTLKNILAPNNIQKNKKTETNRHPPQQQQNVAALNVDIGDVSAARLLHTTGTRLDVTPRVKYLLSTKNSTANPLLLFTFECTCKVQYVGRTSQTLRMRLNKHRFNITCGLDKHSVSRHAAATHNGLIKDFTITPIEQIPGDIPNRLNMLNKREVYLIFKMNTMSPYGLDESLENVF